MSGRRLAVAVLLAGALGSGCDDTGDPSAAAPSTVEDGSPTIRPELTGADDTVLVVGDSLTVGAADIGGLEGRLRSAGFDEVSIVAEEGRDTAWGLGQIEALDAVPPLVLVELGTNRSANPDGFDEDVAAVIDALRARGALHIAWVTPVFATDDRYQDKIEILEDADGIDALADWADVVHDDPALITEDGLHPTEAGYGRLADFLVDAAADLAER